jgi:hypothetical protein
VCDLWLSFISSLRLISEFPVQVGLAIMVSRATPEASGAQTIAVFRYRRNISEFIPEVRNSILARFDACIEGGRY